MGRLHNLKCVLGFSATISCEFLQRYSADKQAHPRCGGPSVGPLPGLDDLSREQPQEYMEIKQF